MPEGDQPKIIIDDDWKAQAQAEKQKLSEQEKAKQPKADTGETGLPDKLEFTDLVQMLATQALVYMGAPDPQTGRAVVSPPMAQLHIDLLGVLDEKTKGNLTEEESTLLTQLLHELRLQFVELGKAIDQAVKEGKIAPPGSGGGGPQGPIGT